ncbi:hypothetical protein [Pontibacter cellulosilyticus]|uniref:Uncharacterized protein n=1 Tax=Pontibacter cellulosilyticus TaxID=1720253 RepID=A0A923N811_9BACT|nr:hypothetical protein [Pontibacter cellulosilyticus]MBC5993477.1 hypothetical protein [Pontibacter cellulosilyticus]
MKIIVLLFAAFLAFGLATKETVSVKATEKEIATAKVAEEVEAPVLNVLLDTVEIAVSSQDVIAGI